MWVSVIVLEIMLLGIGRDEHALVDESNKSGSLEWVTHPSLKQKNFRGKV